MRLGFVGAGAIVEAVVTGLCREGEAPADILLSPRGAEVAARLAARFTAVTVAADNQAVLDGSEVVVLAVTPTVADGVLGELRFRPGQKVVSLIPTHDVARLAPLVAPATAIVRATPVPAVAERRGVITMHPPDAELAALFAPLGRVVPVEAEADMAALWTVSALMGSYFGLLDGTARWLKRSLTDPAPAGAYVAALFDGLGATASARAAEGFPRLIADHSTPGGLNEQAWRELRAAGWGDAVSDVLDLIHARIQGAARFEDGLAGGDQRR